MPDRVEALESTNRQSRMLYTVFTFYASLRLFAAHFGRRESAILTCINAVATCEIKLFRKYFTERVGKQS